ncbi:aryl-alcohol dehydrogenase [Bombiscardovia nodaiensis]|uniref:Aryl-alcohol dehydrogenase n=1 Tax=Bombiscardovia nodaiensis TaxID=2932181 RepID=A0ABM8B9M5_9BIFI|nr:aryl-alcohol dehydrogenase [Bombiscardovia nodaiensis]
MKYTKLGSSELTVSRICMGCMGFGDPQAGQHHWTLREEESQAVIKQGLEAGINFFDTASAYQGGSSERFLGRALKDFTKREDVVVATKFMPRSADDMAAGVSAGEHIRRSLDASLEHLGMDYVDLYIYHMWDYQTSMEEVLAGLDSVVRAGKARYIGISNCYAWQLAQINALAGAEGFPRFVSVQGHYNLIFREEEREMVPLCRKDNIALTPYSALAAGRLSKRAGQSSERLKEDAYARSKYDKTHDQDQVIIDRVTQLADRLGVSMTEVSLAWLLTKVTSPVVGMTKPSHIEGAVKAVDLELSPEDIAWLEEPYLPHALVGLMAENKA